MEERRVLTAHEAVVHDEEKEERIMIRGVSRFIVSTVSNVRKFREFRRDLLSVGSNCLTTIVWFDVSIVRES